VVVGVALAVAALLVTQDGDPPPSLETLADELVATGVPGVLVRLRDGDDVGAFGRGEAVRDDRFRVGSVTKTMVAALALTLADAGALALDDRSRHVPGLPADGDRITVRSLPAHTAGLYDYTHDRASLERRAPRAPSSRSPIAGCGARATRTRARTTSRSGSCSSRRRAPIAELLRRYVFEPFGLEATTFEAGRVSGDYLHGNERASRDGIATGGLRDTHLRPARSAWAAGAVVSSAADLDRFFERLLDSDLGRRMRPAGDARYGLGLARFATGCGPLVGHTGNLLGTITVVGKHGDRLLVAVADVYR
jgi:D-alanyl-D-alanine carboxypeptidase